MNIRLGPTTNLGVRRKGVCGRGGHSVYFLKQHPNMHDLTSLGARVYKTLLNPETLHPHNYCKLLCDIHPSLCTGGG